MQSASCELALKLSLNNNRPIHSTYFRAGNTHLPRTSNLARGNTHFPVFRPGKTPTFRAPQSRPSPHPRQPQGFRSLPTSRPWPQETPYTTVDVFPVVSLPLYPMYPARAGIPFWLRGSTSTLRTLTNAV